MSGELSYVHLRGIQWSQLPVRPSCNRIANGSFTLDGTTYRLPRNNMGHTLHGGPQGFDKPVWTASPFAEEPRVGVVLGYRSPAGEMGFPGNLDTQVTYTLTERNRLRMDYRAATDAPTVVNFTNHAYFNLAGEGSGSTDDHELRIEASHYTPVVDAGLIPTGEIAPVAGTPMDLTRNTAIGERIRGSDPQLAFARGYDHNWVLDRGPRDQPNFPTTVLRPGEEFNSSTTYQFKAR